MSLDKDDVYREKRRKAKMLPMAIECKESLYIYGHVNSTQK
jgi:hypothetical protein